MGGVTLELGLTSGPWRVVRIWPHTLMLTMLHVYDRRVTVWSFRELSEHLKKSGKKLTPPNQNAKP